MAPPHGWGTSCRKISGMSNPLLDFKDLPLFDQVRPEHVAPALDELLGQADHALATVTEAGFPADWQADRVSSSLIQTVDELDALATEWDSLAQPFASPLFDHDWFWAAARVLHDASDLRVFTVRENGRLVGAAPLVVDRSRGRSIGPLHVTHADPSPLGTRRTYGSAFRRTRRI